MAEKGQNPVFGVHQYYAHPKRQRPLVVSGAAFGELRGVDKDENAVDADETDAHATGVSI